MSKIKMLSLSDGRGEPQRREARLKRLAQMESWEDAPELGTKWIPLTNGKRAIVDERDFEFLHQWNWYCSKWGYAVRFVGNKCIFMHSLLIKLPAGKQCDHRDRNRLNNRRGNLRPCSKVQNQGNRWKSKQGRTSQFKGVSFSRKDQVFVAYGREKDKTKRLGAFHDEYAAALAYNQWAKRYFGNFAHLNPV